MRRRRERGIQVKTAAQLAAMSEAGHAVASALRAASAAVAPGVATAELDAVARAKLRARGAVPSFPGYHGFPAAVCTCVNDEIVHGIPSRSRVLSEGDVISISCGASVGGWHADAALTVGVGAIPGPLTRLIGTCEQALRQGIGAAQRGGRLGDISHAVERCAWAAGGYGIVEDYVGHAIGSEMHMDPPVPNRGRRGRGPVLAEGMAFAIEPLLVLGSPDTRLLDDGWTVVSEDGGWAAHCGHTVAITSAGPWVLTALPAPAARAPAMGAAGAPARSEPVPPADGPVAALADGTVAALADGPVAAPAYGLRSYQR